MLESSRFSSRFGTSLVILSIAITACTRRPHRTIYTPSAVGPETPTDANVAAFLLAANNTDISYARIASSRANARSVKDFSARMLADHAAAIDLIRELMTTIDLEPRDDAASLHFRDESAAERSTLRATRANAFDSTYIANEVEFHSRLVNSIDAFVQPSARNPSLKQLVATMRQRMAEHLAHAQRVASEIGGQR
jgi:putative membrane protein